MGADTCLLHVFMNPKRFEDGLVGFCVTQISSKMTFTVSIHHAAQKWPDDDELSCFGGVGRHAYLSVDRSGSAKLGRRGKTRCRC